MSEQDFEDRFEHLLRADAESGVRPIDAVVVARTATARPARRAIAWPFLRRVGVYALVAALLIVSVAAFVFGSGLLVVPAPTSTPGPTPSAAAQSPVTSASAQPTGSAGPSASGSPLVTTTPTSTSSAVPSATPLETGLASPSSSPTSPPSATPTTSPAGEWTSVSAGSLHVCAIRGSTIFCWGENSFGELGDGTTTTRYAPDAPVLGIDDAVDVAAGIRFSCAVRADGSVWCWGENVYDDGSTSVPQSVAGISDAVAVTAGGAHACALRSTASVVCWGMDQLGQLGNGTVLNNNGNATPVEVTGIDDALEISAGWNHTCALRADRTVWCWGGNGDGATGYGQLGDGTLENRPSPVQVIGLSDVVSVAAGGWTTCAARNDGSAWCWGYGERGGLGDGQSTNSPVPLQVSGLDDADQVAVGGWHACAIRSAGTVACWGDNSFAGGGALGDGTRTDRPVPVESVGLSGATQLAIGDTSSFAITATGELWGWGWYLDSSPGRVPGSE